MKFKILLLCTLLQCSSLLAQEKGKQWYKGNTHTHSYWSDGNEFPEFVMDWYKANGYNFVTITDHNTVGQGELWKNIVKKPAVRMVEQKLFDSYLAKYGKDWVKTRSDSSGLSVKLKTLAEYRPRFEEPGKFLILPGEELTAFYKGAPVHMCLINIRETLMPVDGSSKSDLIQKNLDKFYSLKKNDGEPMLVQINHPNFRNSLKFDDLKDLQGARFMEIFNGHPLVNNYGDSSAISTEKLWDKLLISYTLAGKPLIFGIGSEDSHDYHEFIPSQATPGRAWIMVKAEDLSPASLLGAMEKGDFYASTGVTLNDVVRTSKALSVNVKEEKGVNYIIQFWGATKKDTEGVLLKQVNGSKGRAKLKSDWLYVRAKVISSKIKENPFGKGDVETAWTQPVSKPGNSTIH